MDIRKIAEHNKILECLSGSHAYGMSTPASDIDYRGIFVAPPVSLITPFYPVEQVEGPGDRVLFEVSKYLKLAIDQNPNIIELLWVDEADILYRTEAYDTLRAQREALLCSKVAHTFTGYALSQLNRIKGHNKWINNQHDENPPAQADYLRVIFDVEMGREEEGSLPPAFRQDHSLHKMYDQVHGVYPNPGKALCNPDGSLVLNHPRPPVEPVMLVAFNQEAYERDFKNWKGYWDWKRNRNEKRSALEAQHGYDTKHASHLVRLLRMGKEILAEGEVRVKRPDAEELLAIRNGALTYEEIVEYADSMQAEIRALEKRTSLPKKVNPKFAAGLLMDIYQSAWGVELGGARHPSRRREACDGLHR